MKRPIRGRPALRRAIGAAAVPTPEGIPGGRDRALRPSARLRHGLSPTGGETRPAPTAGEEPWRSERPNGIGTCSWADDSLARTGTRGGTAEGRLRHYAERFETVEVNSSYYRHPPAEAAAAWAQRTPDGFVFHVKAFGMMTRHPVKADQLPPDLRARRGRPPRPGRPSPREFRAEVFDRFRSALEPLRETGSWAASSSISPVRDDKGGVVRLPRWAQEQLGGDECWSSSATGAGWRRSSERRDAGLPRAPGRDLRHRSTRRGPMRRTSSRRSSRRRARPPTCACTAETPPPGTPRRQRRRALRLPLLDDELDEWAEPLQQLGKNLDEVYVPFNN